MIAKPITFTDPFTGEEVTRTFYFHISKAELLELEYSQSGGLSNLIKRISEEGHNEKLLPLFKEIIGLSYGVRTDSGGFKKSKDLTEEFMASEAYSTLFMSFFDADVLLEFIQGILPKDLSEELNNKFPEGITDPKAIIDQLKENGNVASNNNTARGTVG